LSSDISMRLTRSIGARRRSCGCQTKASAEKSGAAGWAGASRSKAAAMRAKGSAARAFCLRFGLALDLRIDDLGFVRSP